MDLHTIKNELDTLFQALTQSAVAGDLPNLNNALRFSQLAEKMHMHAPDDWESEAEDFLHLARQLHLAVKREDFQDSVLLLEALRDAQHFCHRIYRHQE